MNTNSKSNVVYTTCHAVHDNQMYCVGFNGYNDPIHVEIDRGGATGLRTWWVKGEPRTELVEKVITVAILKMF